MNTDIAQALEIEVAAVKTRFKVPPLIEAAMDAIVDVVGANADNANINYVDQIVPLMIRGAFQNALGKIQAVENPAFASDLSESRCLSDYSTRLGAFLSQLFSSCP